MEILAIIAAIITSAVLGRYAFKWIFQDDWEDFWDCVKYSLTPDIFSMFRGQYFEDLGQSFKLTGFLVLTFGGGYLVYWAITG